MNNKKATEYRSFHQRKGKLPLERESEEGGEVKVCIVVGGEGGGGVKGSYSC